MLIDDKNNENKQYLGESNFILKIRSFGTVLHKRITHREERREGKLCNKMVQQLSIDTKTLIGIMILDEVDL